jgi:hypothetical protein
VAGRAQVRVAYGADVIMEYDEALADVTDAARVYHGGLMDPVASGSQGSVWSPIYDELLADLAARLRGAGAAYDWAADEAGIAAGDRFDWRGYLARE